MQIFVSVGVSAFLFFVILLRMYSTLLPNTIILFVGCLYCDLDRFGLLFYFYIIVNI